MTRKAYSYIRMSTAAQLRGDSWRRQADRTRAYAETHDLDLVEDDVLYDLGVSAWTGENVTTGAFSAFLQAIRDGKVASGSYLLVESLDRISRQKLRHSLPVLLDIINAGVTVVSLADDKVYGGDIEAWDLMASMMVLGRANEESETKSIRLKEAWKNKRRKIETRALTSICPGWLEIRKDRSGFDLIAGPAETVRDIFEKAIEGWGVYRITKHLNANKTPPIGRAAFWRESYVQKILKSRSAFGEFQPHEMSATGRHPSGAPIENYYPAVVTYDQFIAAQAAKARRKVGGRGRKSVRFSNIFSGIATCAYCQSPMHYINKGRNGGNSTYLRCSMAPPTGDCCSSNWPYRDFEAAFFAFTREIDLAGAFKAAAADEHLAAVLLEIDKLEERKKALEQDRELLFDVRTTVEKSWLIQKLKENDEALSEIDSHTYQLRQSVVADDAPPQQFDAKSQLLELDNADNDEAYRVRARLAADIRRIVKKLELGCGGRIFETERALRHWKEGKQPSAVLDADTQIDEMTARFFLVGLKNGVDREVMISRSDPKRVVRALDVDVRVPSSNPIVS